MLLLEHIGDGERGKRIESAIEADIRERKSVTRDVGGTATTAQFADAIIARLAADGSVLHVSDLHFGRPSVPEQVEAVERLIRAERFDVVAVSGDISQRARPREFRRGRQFLDDAARVSKTIVVPGQS